RRDDGGRLAVQGETLPELCEFLAALHRLDVPATPSQWSPLAPFLAAKQVSAIFEQVRLKNWSLRDVLWTVVDSAACRIARTVRMQFGSILTDAELIVTGGGRLHGVLMKKLQQELGCDKPVPPEDLNFDSNTLDASAVAVLTSLAVNQIPGNLPHLTGAETDRVLGRVIPGSPQNWQKLVQLMASVKPAVRSLRSAM
ncbi:MAG: anhydro-N-acetylmuramic acid kinase, partial [Planctomycetaceae bacterium]|nr:anhydro-N-acetylmuramic acid kinase [Planctomycetaceae bacterium]